MDLHKGVNIFCLCMGIAIAIFAAIGATGAIPNIYPGRVWLLFFFSAIIIVWALLGLRRRK